MRHPATCRWGRRLFGVTLALTLALPAIAQYREYYITGKIVDSNKNPLDKVLISLRDVATSRSYTLKTKADGTFKYVGLPHGVYQVVFKKEGFAEKTDEWRFEAPQVEKMLRVEIPPVVMVSAEVIAEAEMMKEAAASVQAAAEKVRGGDYDGALAALAPILEKNPKDSNALYILGLAQMKKGRWAEAEAAFLQVVEIVPKFAAAYYQLGICYQQSERTEDALAAYAKAMELDPANPDSVYNSGLILFSQSKPADALAMFEKAIALRPDDPASLEMAGRCCISLAAVRKEDGSVEVDKTAFEKALGYLERAKAGYLNKPEKAEFIEGLITLVREQIRKGPRGA
jgi:tetratricopeptide (TPR) repeat protein